MFNEFVAVVGDVGVGDDGNVVVVVDDNGGGVVVDGDCGGDDVLSLLTLGRLLRFFGSFLLDADAFNASMNMSLSSSTEAVTN